MKFLFCSQSRKKYEKTLKNTFGICKPFGCFDKGMAFCAYLIYYNLNETNEILRKNTGGFPVIEFFCIFYFQFLY